MTSRATFHGVGWLRSFRGRPAAVDAGLDVSLAADLRRANRRDRLRALGLAAPLLALLLLSFGIPIVALLARAVYDPTIADALPRTAAALYEWGGGGIPDDAAFASLAEDLREDQASDRLYELAKSLNGRLPGSRSHVIRAARILGAATSAPKAELI